jgi:hypothetical protein
LLRTTDSVSICTIVVNVLKENFVCFVNWVDISFLLLLLTWWAAMCLRFPCYCTLHAIALLIYFPLSPFNFPSLSLSLSLTISLSLQSSSYSISSSHPFTTLYCSSYHVWYYINKITTHRILFKPHTTSDTRHTIVFVAFSSFKIVIFPSQPAPFPPLKSAAKKKMIFSEFFFFSFFYCKLEI